MPALLDTLSIQDYTTAPEHLPEHLFEESTGHGSRCRQARSIANSSDGGRCGGIVANCAAPQRERTKQSEALDLRYAQPRACATGNARAVRTFLRIAPIM